MEQLDNFRGKTYIPRLGSKLASRGKLWCLHERSSSMGIWDGAKRQNVMPNNRKEAERLWVTAHAHFDHCCCDSLWYRSHSDWPPDHIR